MSPSGRPLLSGPLHAAAHLILVAFGWCVFGLAWWSVLQQGPHAVREIVWLIGGAAVMLPVVTLYWVLHNRGIYARKGPRQHVVVADLAYTHDWAGRTVRADFADLRRAAQVVIDTTPEEKHFAIEPAEPPRLRAA